MGDQGRPGNSQPAKHPSHRLRLLREKDRSSGGLNPSGAATGFVVSQPHRLCQTPRPRPYGDSAWQLPGQRKAMENPPPTQPEPCMFRVQAGMSDPRIMSQTTYWITHDAQMLSIAERTTEPI